MTNTKEGRATKGQNNGHCCPLVENQFDRNAYRNYEPNKIRPKRKEETDEGGNRTNNKVYNCVLWVWGQLTHLSWF